MYLIYNSHFLRQKAKNILTYKVSVAIPTNLMNLKSAKSSTEKRKVKIFYTQKNCLLFVRCHKVSAHSLTKEQIVPKSSKNEDEPPCGATPKSQNTRKASRKTFVFAKKAVSSCAHAYLKHLFSIYIYALFRGSAII